MDISVIIVEYMDIKILETAILSVYGNISELSTEIIVVSNSSYSEEKKEEIQLGFKETQFIFNQKNLGFAKAVNQGIKISSGEFVMLLNPDARLLDDSLLRAVEFMRDNANIAVVGPMTLDGHGELHDTFRNFMSPWILVTRTFRRLLNLDSRTVLENKNFSQAQKVDWVSGGCLITKRSAIDSSGLMDERYFMYVEDMDWCKRFQQNGMEVWYLPEWKIEHIGGLNSTSTFNITNKLMWIHLISFCKYYFKWLGLRWSL